MQQPDPTAPIGVFDSGVGGLTVARAIRDQLPTESLLYVGDTAHTPYGPRKIGEVRQFALEILDGLVEQGAKLLVIACNTASAAMFRDANERYDVPVIEVIRPTIRSAVSITRTKHIGMIGTEGTVRSGAYQDLMSMRPDIEFYTQAAPKFVELVEAGVTAGPEVEAVAREYLEPLMAHKIDTLVLACTHYPFLKGAIRNVMGDEVALVSSDTETALEVYRKLSDRQLLRPASAGHGELKYEATGENTQSFQDLARRMLGIEVPEVGRIHPPTGMIDLRGLRTHTAQEEQ